MSSSKYRGPAPITGFAATMLLFRTMPVDNPAYRAIDDIPRPVDARFAGIAGVIDNVLVAPAATVKRLELHPPASGNEIQSGGT